MSMSRLLIKVAHSTGINVYNEEKAAYTSGNVTVSGQTGQRTQGAVYCFFFIALVSGLICCVLQGRQHHNSDLYPA